MTEPVGTAQDALRGEILNAVLYDWVPMIEVDQIVTQQRLAAGDAERFDLVMTVIRALLDEGLVSVGDLPGDGDQIPDWGLSVDDAIQRISDEYIVRHGEPTEWEFRIWIGLTAEGRAAAEVRERR
jgi:hypothetical protein